jgi:hypothetical protein
LWRRNRYVTIDNEERESHPQKGAPSIYPTNPPCVLCDSTEHVDRVDLPEYHHIHHYRCLSCGRYWITNLRGERILTSQDDDSMLFV